MSELRICKSCNEQFQVEYQDIAFLEKFSPRIGNGIINLPIPTNCPDCRMQRRLIWRNELNLFKAQDALTHKPLLTFIPPITKAKVLSVEQWHSDAWDELAYGRDFDFTRSFFDQFKELVETVPLIALANIRCENSDYANCAAECKSCYLIGGANGCEYCLYGNYINRSKNCVDCNFVDACEICYECVDCKDCYHVSYAQDCSSCSDSRFLFQCRNVSSCFGCVNLANARHCVFNEQLTEREYREFLNHNKLSSRAEVAAIFERFSALKLRFPHRAFRGEHLENVVGSSINRSRNCYNCFDATELDNCRHCSWLHSSRDCMDIFSWGMAAELCYECLEVGDDSYQTLFSATTWGSSNILYSYLTKSSKDCFGCVGARRKQYCILNKQYDKRQYESLLLKIAEHMQKTGEWGEFFPMDVSPHAYNTSICNDYFPLSVSDARLLSAKWYESPSLEDRTAMFVPDTVPNDREDLTKAVYRCEVSGKPFRLVSPEVAFYQSEKLPLPSKSFPERHRGRLALRPPRKVWKRECQKCSADMFSVYAPTRKETVYCPSCFAKELV